MQQTQTFKLVNCWTANPSWFPKVKIINHWVWHIPEFYVSRCNAVVAKNPNWLVNLLFFHCVVKVRASELIVLNWTHRLPPNPPLLSGLLPQGTKHYLSTQLPNPAVYGSSMTSASSTASKLSPSPLNPTCKLSPCVSPVPFLPPYFRLPSLLHCLNLLQLLPGLPASSPGSCPINSHCSHPGQSKSHSRAGCSLPWTFGWLPYDINVL